MTIEGSVNADEVTASENGNPFLCSPSHGGVGSCAATSAATDALPTHGSLKQPVDVGYGGNYCGGDGGGAIHLIVGGTLHMSAAATLTANGFASHQWFCRGAAGGSVWLEAGVLTGASRIAADANGGGGGRVALHIHDGLATNAFTGSLSAAGHMCGTVYIAATQAQDLHLPNIHCWVPDASVRLGNVEVPHLHTVLLNYGTLNATSLDVAGHIAAGMLRDKYSATPSAFGDPTMPSASVYISALASVHVRGTGSVNADATVAAETPGCSLPPDGAHTCLQHSEDPYLDVEQPRGLGVPCVDLRIPSGGHISIHVEHGDLVVDAPGRVSADARRTTTVNWAAAGSVLVRARELRGDGTIRAFGDIGNGGRVAVHTTGAPLYTTFTGRLAADGVPGVVIPIACGSVHFGGTSSMANRNVVIPAALVVTCWVPPRASQLASLTVSLGASWCLAYGALNISGAADVSGTLYMATAIDDIAQARTDVRSGSLALHAQSLTMHAGGVLHADGASALNRRRAEGPSHGGAGGGLTQPSQDSWRYGDEAWPTTLGESLTIPSGGGTVHVQVEQEVNMHAASRLSANGGGDREGDAGGSVLLEAGALHGGGTIEARASGSHAGGGRVALHIDQGWDPGFTGAVLACPKDVNVHAFGGCGSVFINMATAAATAIGTPRDSLLMDGVGATIAGWVPPRWRMPQVRVGAAAVLTLQYGVVNATLVDIKGQLRATRQVGWQEAASAANAANQPRGAVLVHAHTLNIASGAVVTASLVSPQGSAGGVGCAASHGGIGRCYLESSGAAAPVHGSVEWPLHFGTVPQAGGTWGAGGGGHVHLRADNDLVIGTGAVVSSDGFSNQRHGCSGGSIILQVQGRLLGSGTVQALGATGGAGGRIALHLQHPLAPGFVGKLNTLPTDADPGSVGTVYIAVHGPEGTHLMVPAGCVIRGWVPPANSHAGELPHGRPLDLVTIAAGAHVQLSHGVINASRVVIGGHLQAPRAQTGDATTLATPTRASASIFVDAAAAVRLHATAKVEADVASTTYHSGADATRCGGSYGGSGACGDDFASAIMPQFGSLVRPLGVGSAALGLEATCQSSHLASW